MTTKPILAPVLASFLACAVPASLARSSDRSLPYRHFDCTTKAAPALTLRPLAGGLQVAFSPDGKSLAVRFGGFVELWDLKREQKSHTIPGHGTGMTDVAFSPCGRYVVTVAHWDHTARLWDSATGCLLRSFTWKDNRSTVKVYQEGDVRVEETTSGGLCRSMERAAFSPDGKHLATPGYSIVTATGSGEDDVGMIRLWDVNSGKAVTTLHGHTAKVNAVAYRPDGKEFASGASDGTVFLWDLRRTVPVLTFRASANSVYALAYSPNGRRLACTAGTGEATIWELGRLSAAGMKPTTSGREWDMSRDPTHLALRVDRDAITSLNWSPDGKYISTAGVYWGDATGSFACISLWDATTGKMLANLGSGKRGYSGLGTAFSPDGKQFASSHTDGTVRIWNLAQMLGR
jgi:dipeptidyl aminopeptidase/acylaminoacyl peptidase